MALTESEMATIKQMIDNLIAAPLQDVATSNHMAVQLIRETMNELKACKTELEALSGELERTSYRVVDAETSAEAQRGLVKLHKARVAKLEIRLEEKQIEINDLKQQLNNR